MWELVLIVVASYLIGSFPTAYLIVKWRFKADIRQYGSRSVGASNVFRSFSKPWGLLVFFWDFGKGALVVWIARLLNLDLLPQIAAALAVIIGHNWPVFLKFNAGRGLATTLGAELILAPWLIFMYMPGFICVILFRRQVALIANICLTVFPLASWILQKPSAITLGLLAMYVLTIIRRLTPPRDERSKSVSTGDLLINRFLFDRDIRDAKTWIDYKPKNQKK